MEKQRIVVKKRRRLRVGRLILFLLAVVILLTILGFGVYFLYWGGKSAYDAYSEIAEDFERRQLLYTKLQDGKFANHTNILLLGIDDGEKKNDVSTGQRSDSLLLVSVNNQSGFINILSIPRDTKVNIPGRNGEDKINQAYYYGGVQLTARTVETLLQVPIQHYIVIDMKVVEEFINQMGGMYFYVENDMDYEDPYAELSIHFEKGYQYLDGNKAMQYLRYRSDELGDVGRVQRQQKFLKAVYAELFRPEVVTKIPGIVDIINRRVTTSLAVLDAAHVAKGLSGSDPSLIKTEMLPGKLAIENDTQYWSVDGNKLAEVLDGMFKIEKKAENQEEKK